MRKLIFAALIMLVASAAGAATHYVDDSGSNTNPGTLASPFRTIQHGVSQLQAGDSLAVRGGTYNEAVTLWSKYGTSSAPINLFSYNGESVIIDGTGTSSSNGVVVIGGGSSYINFDGFTVRNGPNAGIFIYDGNNIKVRWNTVHTVQKAGINASSASSSAWGTTHHIVIHGNNVYDTNRSNIDRNEANEWQQAVSAYRADYVEITGNYVHENYGEGIDYILSDHGTIRDNELWDNFSVNIYLDNAQSTVVDRNFIVVGWATNYTNFYRFGGPSGGIGIANETYTVQNPANDLTITNNIVIGTRHGLSYGNYQYGGGLHNTLIANNTFVEADNLSIYIENGTSNVHDTTTIKNNVFYAKSGTNYAYANSTGITWSYNCWYNGNSGTHKSGAGDILNDPQFVNAGGSDAVDYKLTSTSPCKDTGSATSAVTTDYWGTTRAGRGTGIDIGAHEY